MSIPRFRKSNHLTRDNFELLLATLHPDRETAAAQYEQIRRTMIVFFEFRGSATPDDDADETIDRVARRLHEGRKIFAANQASYFYAVARNVWREKLAFPITQVSFETESLKLRQSAPSPLELLEESEQHAARESRLSCLEHCLHQLKPHEYELIVGYYFGDGRARIENRQALARQLGVPINALRIRAHRLREKLETCVARCAKQRAPRRR